MGIGTFDNGKFNLWVRFLFNPKKAEKAQWKEGLQDASNYLYQASHKKLYLGTITISSKANSIAQNDADAWIYGDDFGGRPNSDESDRNNCLVPLLGQPDKCFRLLNGDRYRPVRILHEFSHYALCLFDEYLNEDKDTGQIISGNCCHELYPRRCIMEVTESTILEYCDYGSHQTGNLQDMVHGKSCWDTICSIPRYNVNALVTNAWATAPVIGWQEI